MIRLPRLDPDLAYIGSSLFLPKRHLEEGPVYSALTFGLDGDNEPRVLVREHRDHLEVPRAFLTQEQLADLELRVIDTRPRTYPRISLNPKPGFSLRPRQIAAWEEVRKPRSGILAMACGSGKTIVGLKKASHLKVPTLIVSHQAAHLENWEKELKAHFTLKGPVGWIRGKRMEYDREIVFATIQTLANKVRNGGLPPDFFNRFGLVIFDEVHHLAAAYFALTADLVSGERLGLTATTARTDRLEGIIFSHLGPVFYEDLDQEMDPTFYIEEIDLPFTDADEKEIIDKGGMRNLSLLRGWLGCNPDRNTEIRRRVIDPCIARGRIIYALTHSEEHARLMSSYYPQSGCITGKTPSDQRLSILHGHDLVFATMGVGAEAYNRDDLNVLVLMTPFAATSHAAIQFQQSTGRVQRKLAGKPDPEVYLIVDKNIEESRGLMGSLVWKARNQGYEVKGWNSSQRRQPRRW